MKAQVVIGTLYVNHQVRADSAEPVLATARRACVGLAYVAPARNGWVAVYDESSDTQDEPTSGCGGSRLGSKGPPYQILLPIVPTPQTKDTRLYSAFSTTGFGEGVGSFSRN